MNTGMHKRLQFAPTGLWDLAHTRAHAAPMMMTGRKAYITNYEIDLSGPAAPFAVEAKQQAQLQRLHGILQKNGQNGQNPQRVLISGQTGAGKSSLATWLAYHAGAPLFRLPAGKFAGLAVKAAGQELSIIFRQATSRAPAVLLLDDLHDLETAFPEAEQRETITGQIFRQMANLDGKPVLLLLATRHPERLGVEWFSPGRIQLQVKLGLPDSLTRLAILRQHTQSLRLAFDVNLISLARSAPGLSAADLAQLCRQASQSAAANERARVNMADFQAALERFLLEHADTRLADEA
jgi:cell division protease FtsH